MVCARLNAEYESINTESRGYRLGLDEFSEFAIRPPSCGLLELGVEGENLGLFSSCIGDNKDRTAVLLDSDIPAANAAPKGIDSRRRLAKTPFLSPLVFEVLSVGEESLVLCMVATLSRWGFAELGAGMVFCLGMV